MNWYYRPAGHGITSTIKFLTQLRYYMQETSYIRSYVSFMKLKWHTWGRVLMNFPSFRLDLASNSVSRLRTSVYISIRDFWATHDREQRDTVHITMCPSEWTWTIVMLHPWGPDLSHSSKMWSMRVQHTGSISDLPTLDGMIGSNHHSATLTTSLVLSTTNSRYIFQGICTCVFVSTRVKTTKCTIKVGTSTKQGSLRECPFATRPSADIGPPILKQGY